MSKIKVLNTLDFKEIEKPKILEGSWSYCVFFKNHPTLDGIACLYFNNKYPNGYFCVGDYILNDYPDVYATWKKDKESGKIITDRMWVSPIIRKKGIGKAALFWGAQSLQYMFDKKLVHEYGNEIGNKLYVSAFNVDSVESTKSEDTIDLREEFFNQPAYPYVFFGKRPL
jgi:hypothetical protein